MKLSSVVPWGRSFAEYQAMFALSADDLQGRILGCGDGPASFNAEATRLGYEVVSCDPIYRFDTAAIRGRIDAVYPEIMKQMREGADQYLWDVMGSVERLGETRMQSMSQFLEDFDAGLRSGRYVPASLPSLPFADASFALALCSHYLFLYSEHVDCATHLASMRELCRVAQVVRVFPVVALNGAVSPHLAAVMTALRAEGLSAELQPVAYRFQRGADQMLVVRAQGCR